MEVMTENHHQMILRIKTFIPDAKYLIDALVQLRFTILIAHLYRKEGKMNSDKPLCPMINEEGEMVLALSMACHVLKRENQLEQIKELLKEFRNCTSYDQGVALICRYVKPCTAEDYQQMMYTEIAEQIQSM